MDIKQQLLKVADAHAAVFNGVDDVRGVCRDALAEIQQLETNYRSLEGAIAKQAPLERIAATLDKMLEGRKWTVDDDMRAVIASRLMPVWLDLEWSTETAARHAVLAADALLEHLRRAG